jgi:hypothetical protein
MNPALRLPKPGGDEQGRERVLSDAEIRKLRAVLEAIKRLKRRSSEDEYVGTSARVSAAADPRLPAVQRSRLQDNVPL